jgi:hypothetical protein
MLVGQGACADLRQHAVGDVGIHRENRFYAQARIGKLLEFKDGRVRIEGVSLENRLGVKRGRRTHCALRVHGRHFRELFPKGFVLGPNRLYDFEPRLTAPGQQNADKKRAQARHDRMHNVRVHRARPIK